MKIIKKTMFLVVILAAVLVVVGLFLPSKKYVERAVTITAPLPVIFTNVNNLKRRFRWDPWKGENPGWEFTFGDIIAGKGASVAWNQKDEETVDLIGFLPEFARARGVELS